MDVNHSQVALILVSSRFTPTAAKSSWLQTGIHQGSTGHWCGSFWPRRDTITASHLACGSNFIGIVQEKSEWVQASSVEVMEESVSGVNELDLASYYHLVWTRATPHTQTHTNTFQVSPLPSSHIHVCHCTPSGYAGSGKTSRAKFRKQLRKITAHQWPEFQLHFQYVSVSQKVPLVKSLTPQLETAREEKQHSCMWKMSTTSASQVAIRRVLLQDEGRAPCKSAEAYWVGFDPEVDFTFRRSAPCDGRRGRMLSQHFIAAICQEHLNKMYIIEVLKQHNRSGPLYDS